ncbi:MAG: glycosyltransferase involved in cell wall biosynthesis [Planctomycetota bacterium]|jgi:glycosyltransferase involved in cell wall biosynthesis
MRRSLRSRDRQVKEGREKATVRMLSGTLSEAPRVSILLPTLNAERDLARLLPALAAQEIDGGFELIAVDSDSSDRTRELLEAAGARVERIERRDFRHGPTRNQLVQMARAPIVVFLSQDAVPQGKHCIASLIDAFQDEAVVGATGRVLPYPEDDPLTQRSVLAAPEAGSLTRRMRAPTAGLDGVPPADLLELCRFNDVVSAMRTSVVLALPLPDLPFGEDVAWAREALRSGHELVFAASAVVLHSHHYTPAQAFERFRVDAAFLRREFQLRVRPNLFSVVRGIAHELRQDWRHLVGQNQSRLHWLRSLLLRPAQIFGQYFGSNGWALPGGSSATRQYR